ncbi:MAG: hypothetical protein PF692_01485 [Kiritimatiellae bacterium]|nr:hypothetical protein [Kiritimatiellia bacterium]
MKRIFIAMIPLFFFVSKEVNAEVKISRVLGSHMVLQRDMLVPIWGTAMPGEKITVSFRSQKKTTVTDSTGKWIIKLEPLKVGQPSSLTISGKNTIVLEDVLVGEVWVGSGQSNMDTDVPDYVGYDQLLKEAASKNHTNLRIFRSDYGDGWQLTTPESVRRFSAQLFYFGMLLQENLKVPVGLMEGAVRGSPAANWIPNEVIKTDDGINAAIADYEKYHPYAEIEAQHQEQLKQWQQKIDALPADTPKDKYPGKPWLAPPAGHTNGPRGDFYLKHIVPMIPYAIKGVLWDQGEGGVNINGVNMNVVMKALIATWRKDWGQGDFPFLFVQKPSGGGCALNPNSPITKGACAFAPLPQSVPQRYWDADARLHYIKMMEIPNTYMVFTSDLMPGVHPANKSGYASRGCRVALGAVYEKKLEYYGPIYKSHKIEKNQIRLSFSHIGKGLVFPPDQKLQGFAIAGEDRRFFWADAVIDGDIVIVSSPEVEKPVAVRYAWSWWFPWANLFNKDGLPALTFRTDQWW